MSCVHLAEATTTTLSTHTCPLKEGMGQPLYLSEPEFNGSHRPSIPNINPGGEGVTFTSTVSVIAISIAPSIRPIIEYVSIANPKITNVNRLFVSVIGPDGFSLQSLKSPAGKTVVTGFSSTPLPENTTLLISFQTVGGVAPANITLSVIACFEPLVTTVGESI